MKIKLFSTSLQTMVIRFYLMMAVVLLGLLLNSMWTLFLGMPVFIVALLGLKFEFGK